MKLLRNGIAYGLLLGNARWCCHCETAKMTKQSPEHIRGRLLHSRHLFAMTVVEVHHIKKNQLQNKGASHQNKKASNHK